ncbi:MAG: hypothetical protein STSR0008_16740 [Ignavibacterium sp.]
MAKTTNTKSIKKKLSSKGKTVKQKAKKTSAKKVTTKSKTTEKNKPKSVAKPVKKLIKSVKKSSNHKPETKVKVEKVEIKKPVETIVEKHLPTKHYSKKDLEYFRKIILDRKQEIISQIESLREQMVDSTTGEYINENSPYSLHMAEQGTDSMEKEKTYLYAQRESKFLGYLDEALKRIDAGTYGICVECIDEPKHLCPTCPLIPKERLEAVPHTQMCMQIKEKQEKNK